ncbi:MAG: hypothetical protein FJ100_18070 [Deltaproteobacteria bacterium]|nr:hypothetical protein [Deltaproteobacteria bacterium]
MTIKLLSAAKAAARAVAAQIDGQMCTLPLLQGGICANAGETNALRRELLRGRNLGLTGPNRLDPNTPLKNTHTRTAHLVSIFSWPAVDGFRVAELIPAGIDNGKAGLIRVPHDQ